jgi:hypothetical protein
MICYKGLMILCLTIHSLINIGLTIFKPSNNEDDEMLDLNMTINVVVDDGIIPLVPEFEDASKFTFVVSHDQAISHRRLLGGFDLEVRQTFSNKNELINIIK